MPSAVKKPAVAARKDDSDSDLDKSMHNLEAPILHKKRAKVAMSSTSLTPRG